MLYKQFAGLLLLCRSVVDVCQEVEEAEEVEEPDVDIDRAKEEL